MNTRADFDSPTLNYRGGIIRPTYMPEYGDYVWQPNHPNIGWARTPEPYVTLEEAKAFLRGVDTILASIGDLD